MRKIKNFFNKIDWFKVVVVITILSFILLIGITFGIPIIESHNICNEMNITGC